MSEVKRFKAIISGGGTGGHVFPAIAIANAIKQRDEDAQILFVGAKGKLEMDKVPAAGFEIVGLNIRGFQRKLTFANFKVLFQLVGSILKSVRIVKRFQPDVAIGVGGYASGPVLAVCGFLGVPTVLQEQNSFAGITNKILARRAKKICTAYENMDRFFNQEKIVLTGNPVRREIAQMTVEQSEGIAHFGLDRAKKTLLVIGGSLGARTINQSIEEGMQALTDAGFQVIWQTGKSYYDKAKKNEEIFPNFRILQFIERMDLAYAAADMIVSRAGALSISELALVSKPVILVPSPNVAEDHQTHNAMALVNKNAALMVRDDAAMETLVKNVIELSNDRTRADQLAANLKPLAVADAADRIAGEVMQVVNG